GEGHAPRREHRVSGRDRGDRPARLRGSAEAPPRGPAKRGGCGGGRTATAAATAMTARLALAVVVLFTACATVSPRAIETVRLQLKWVPQAQFAGYYAALYQDFY